MTTPVRLSQGSLPRHRKKRRASLRPTRTGQPVSGETTAEVRLIYVGGAIAAHIPARLRSQIIESRAASPDFVTETALFRDSLDRRESLIMRIRIAAATMMVVAYLPAGKYISRR